MMQRRRFFTLLALIAPKWARAQSEKMIDAEAMRALARVVLPESLGRQRTDKIADDFMQWIRNYKEGVNMASGYGNPRTQIVPPNPSKRYPEQLRALQSAEGAIKRVAVEHAIADAKLDRLPNRPDGKHVAVDLLAYFFSSSEGEDYLYGVAIKRDDCRGLGNSSHRPAPLS